MLTDFIRLRLWCEHALHLQGTARQYFDPNVLIVPASNPQTKRCQPLAERARWLVAELHLPALGAEPILLTQEQAGCRCVRVAGTFKRDVPASRPTSEFWIAPPAIQEHAFCGGVKVEGPFQEWALPSAFARKVTCLDRLGVRLLIRVPEDTVCTTAWVQLLMKVRDVLPSRVILARILKVLEPTGRAACCPLRV